MFNFARKARARDLIGPQGEQGPAGPQGEQGAPGEPAAYRAPVFARTNDAPAGHPLPTRAHDDDAGYDLTSTHPVHLAPGRRMLVTLGVSVVLDPRTVGLMCPRSGLASRDGITVLNAPGVIDSGYRGELKAVVYNAGHSAVHLPAGTRVAQLVVVPVVTDLGAAPSDKTRGANGFGSTGTTTPHAGLTSGSKAEVARRARADMVNAPAHYTAHPVFTGQCHDFAKFMGFDRGNAFKYLWRCAGKGDMSENLRKALWYLKAMEDKPTAHDRLAVPGDGRLENELTRVFDQHDADKCPVKFRAALAAYTAAVYVAKGGLVHEAQGMVALALTDLDNEAGTPETV